MSEVIAAILAGGRSARMGQDKAALVWQGETLLERSARACLVAGLSVMVVGREQPADWAIEGVLFIPDETPGRGPLGGIITALKALDLKCAVLALACDMPLLDSVAIGWLASEARQLNGIDGIVTVTDYRRQPLFAVYTGSALTLLQQSIASGRLSLTSAIERGTFRTVIAPPVIAAKLVNVNTPEEFNVLGGRNMQSSS